MGKNKQITIIILFALLLCAQIATCLYFGSRKSGFHEDEFYSYYSTNKTAGLFVNDREWQEKDQYRNEFVVLPGETFRYGIVAKMQSWDVHPPLYYFLLHTACSLFTGEFSKWLGIGVNLIAFILNFFLLIYLTKTVSGENGWLTAWLVCGVWGFAPAVISGVMFIRMYEWLTLFVLLCACIHVRAMKRKERKILTFYLPLLITVYLGFLTQYYYIIFHVFIGIGFCLWLLWPDANRSEHWFRDGVIECLKYGAACAVALGAAIVSYPASLSHIFRGYRGTEAVSEFSNISNTWERLRFFFGLLDDYVLSGVAIWCLILVVLFCMTARQREGKNMAVYFVLLLAVIGYFFTISKTALLLGVTSNRYQLPIYGIIILLILIPFLEKGVRSRFGRIPTQYVGVIMGFLLILLNVYHLFGEEKVFFLYEEEADIMAYAKENAHSDVVVFYNEDTPANVWRLSDELMEYDRIYLVSQGNKDPITDEAICNSDKLVVYVTDDENMEQYSEMILSANSNVGEQQLIAKKELWTIYQFE